MKCFRVYILFPTHSWNCFSLFGAKTLQHTCSCIRSPPFYTPRKSIFTCTVVSPNITISGLSLFLIQLAYLFSSIGLWESISPLDRLLQAFHPILPLPLRHLELCQIWKLHRYHRASPRKVLSYKKPIFHVGDSCVKTCQWRALQYIRLATQSQSTDQHHWCPLGARECTIFSLSPILLTQKSCAY